MPNVGWPELLLLLMVALLIFGPQRLAGIGAILGKTIREFRRSLGESEDTRDDSKSM